MNLTYYSSNVSNRFSGYGWIIVVALTIIGIPGHAGDFVDVITRAPNVNNSQGRLCFAANNRIDIGCSSDAPYLDMATGYLGIGTTTTSPSTALDISGTLRLANGGEACDVAHLGSIRYSSGSFDICRDTAKGWEPLASSTEVAIDTGLSGSLVFRDEYGKLKARNDLSVSSTTGSVGIGMAAPASLGNNSLWAGGHIRANANVYGTIFSTNGSTGGYYWAGNNERITGDTNNKFINIVVSNTEALRIVSNGYVGIGTSNPSDTLHVVGPAKVTGMLSVIRPIIAMGNFSTRQDAFIQMTNGSGGHSGNWALMVPYGATSSAGSNYDFVIRHANAGVNVLNIDDLTMNVGIHTANPSATLHVSGTILASRNQSKLSISPWESGSDQGVDISTNGSGFTRYAMQFLANSRRQVVITQSGTVIGNNLLSNNTAYTPLDVNGTLKIASSGEACDANRLGAMRYVSGSFHICRNTTIGWENLATSTIPDRITSGTTQAIAYDNTSLSLVTNGTERMVVGTNGEVGIGQSLPRAALDVSGAIKISGDGTEGCDSAADNGKIRINPTTRRLQICKF